MQICENKGDRTAMIVTGRTAMIVTGSAREDWCLGRRQDIPLAVGSSFVVEIPAGITTTNGATESQRANLALA